MKDAAKVIALSSHGSDMNPAALVRSDRQFEGRAGKHGPAHDAGGGRSRREREYRQGGTRRDRFDQRLPGAGDMFDHRKDKTMTGDRMLSVDDVANAVLFLASPLADLIQGETLTVDGGAAVHV